MSGIAWCRVSALLGLVAEDVRLRGMDDDDRALCVMDALLTYRAEDQRR
jgi:hypothetical protein